jgi:hypothetical protein
MTALRWFEHADRDFRRVGFADEINRYIRHCGWFADDCQDSVLRGVVYRLPTRQGKPAFLYGYADPWNDGAALLALKTADNESDAARWADRIAELEAEKERDYQEAWQAGNRYRDLADEIASERKSCLALIREAKAACESICRLPAVKAALRSTVESHLEAIRDARKQRAKLLDGYGHTAAFNDA